jgi:hypothetical protein
MAEKIERRLAGVAAADVLDAFDAEVLVGDVACIGQSVGAEKQRVSGLELHREFIIGCSREKPRGKAGNLKDVGLIAAKQKRSSHAGANNAQSRGGRVNKRVLNRGVAARDSPEEQPFVQEREHAPGLHTGFVDAAKRAYGKGSIESRAEALPRDIPNVQTYRIVAELELIEVVASHLRYWLELAGNGHAGNPQRMRGQHDVLNRASFFQLLLAKLFNRMQIQRK